MITETLSSTQEASAANSLVRPWGSFLSEQLYKWKTGEIECGCRDMAIFVRRIVSDEIEREKTQSNRPNGRIKIMTPPPITQLEMSEADIEFAEKIAKRLGFTQTAYTSSSAIWGLFCLPDRASQRHGVIVKTAQFGFMFMADLEDMQLHDLHEATLQLTK